MDVTVDLQIACEGIDESLIAEEKLKHYVTEALEGAGYEEPCELTIRFAEASEVQQLNNDYRGINKSTNILSFPFECPPEVKLPLLGDLVICHEVLEREAQEQHKTVEEHLAHLIVHGVLHLLGYDHIEDDEAEEMENLERKIVTGMGFADPYEERE